MGVSPYRDILATLKPHEMLKLGGNGMNLAVIESVWLFMLSHCVWVDQSLQTAPEVNFRRRGATCFFDEWVGDGDDDDQECGTGISMAE